MALVNRTPVHAFYLGLSSRYNTLVRILLPTRIPVQKALLFTLVLVLVELVEGTDPKYSLVVFAYLMLSVFAFNVAGGFSRPSGAYIFFYSVLAGGVGTIYKMLLGQAADTHLQQPLLIISVYTATVGCLLIAAFATRKIVRSTNGVAGLMHVPKLNLGTSALGCIVMVFLIDNAFAIFPGGSGSILHAISMVNYFLPLGILLGTAAAVKSSGGRRSTSPIIIGAIIYSTLFGMAGFSKQGMFTPFVCWMLGMAWAGFQLRMRHILVIVGFSIIAQTFLVPLANVGREEVVANTRNEQFAIIEDHILHPEALREKNRQSLESYSGLDIWYYGTPQGIFDRFTMLPNDSQLIAFTAQGHYFGYLPVFVYFENWVPHIIDPNKVDPTSVGGNRYSHEMGLLADADTTTGISYSPSAEAFHMDGWTSVFLIEPLVFILLFVTTDFVCGDLRAQPWGLLPVLLFAHIAPEGGIGGSINWVWLGNVGTIFAIFVCGYVAPVFGKLLRGREREPLWRANLQSADAIATQS